MTYLSSPALQQRFTTPNPIDTENEAETRTQDAHMAEQVNQVSEFIKDHFVNGGKMGASLAIVGTRYAHMLAQDKTDMLTAALPAIREHIAGLPTALRAMLVSGGDTETRNILHAQLQELANDASLATNAGVMWGLTGLAYAAMPLTVATGYALGAALGQERTGQLINDAINGRAA